MKKITELMEWGLELWSRYRPSCIQRFAGYTVLTGIGLVILSFNDILFEFALKPIGFERQGYLGPILSIIFVAIGIATLIADRIADNTPSLSKQQDSALFRQILETMPWNEFDDFLNNLHNHWYWSDHFDNLFRLSLFLKDEANKHVDRRLQKTLADFDSALDTALHFLGRNFYSLEKEQNRYRMLPEISVENTGTHNPTFLTAARQVENQVECLEQRYRKYVRTGRDLGMIPRADSTEAF